MVQKIQDINRKQTIHHEVNRVTCKHLVNLGKGYTGVLYDIPVTFL